MLIDQNGRTYAGGHPGSSSLSEIKYLGKMPGKVNNPRLTRYSNSAIAGVLYVDDGGVLSFQGKKVESNGGKFTAGTTYAGRYLSDAEGTIWRFSSTLNRLDKVANAPQAPANIDLGSSFVDANGQAWTLSDATATKVYEGQKLTPNQWHQIDEGDTGSPSHGSYVDENGELDLNLIGQKKLTGLTAGTYYGGNLTFIVDSSGQIAHRGFTTYPVYPSLSDPSMGVPQLVTGTFYTTNTNRYNDYEYIYISDKDGVVWELEYGSAKGEGYYVVHKDSELVTKPGQMYVAEASTTTNVFIQDNDGTIWNARTQTPYPGATVATGKQTTNDCVVGQLPQSGDPAASWWQAAPYVVAVVAVAAEASVVVVSKRRLPATRRL